MPGSFGISNGHFGKRAGFATGFGTGIFLGDFEPELDGFADVDESFRLRVSLTPATRQRGATNGKSFIGRNENHRIFHGATIMLRSGQIKFTSTSAISPIAEAGAQIFFQPARRAEVKRRRSEGGFKGDVVLPVGEIGEVIFADCFREEFQTTLLRNFQVLRCFRWSRWVV